MKTILKSILAFVFAIVAHNCYAQFATATVNAVIGAGEYGVHTNGQNQETSGAVTTYIAWDATNLYVGVSGANITEGFVMYIDTDPQVPVNGGTNANGTNVGFPYDLANFASLQFRANAVIYAKNGYREFRTADGSNGWSGPTAGFGSYLDAGSIREFSLPWANIGGFPASFNFFNYVTSGTGFVYGQTPTVNAGGNIGLSARYERYYTVSTTAAIGTTKPFSRESYVFNGTSNVSGFGAISVWDFTLNSANTITRGGGNWNIGNKLTISQGTINFGTGPFGTSTFGDGIALINAATLNMSSSNQPIVATGSVTVASGSTLTLSTAPGGDLQIGGTTGTISFNVGGTLNNNGRTVTMNASTTQFLVLSTASIQNLVIANTASAECSINSNVSITNSFTINSGSKFRLDSPSILNLTGASSTINGTFEDRGGTITGGTNTFGATGTYIHNYNGGSIPTATWNTGSTCLITGITSTVPTGLTQTFHNFTWNCSTQSAIINLAANISTVNGDFQVASTNGQQLRYAEMTPATPTLTIGGNLIMSSGIFLLTSGTSSPTINIAGNLDINTGTLDMSLSTGTAIINLGGNFTQTGGILQKTGTGSGTITFNNTSSATITQSGGTISNNINWNIGTGSSLTAVSLASNLNLGTGTGTFTVANLANFNCGTFVLSGSGTFAISANQANLIIGDANGISSSGATGNIRTSTRSFGPSSYSYWGSGAQITGSGLPSTAFYLSVQATSINALILTNPLTLTGGLTLSRVLDLGANNLTLNPAATIVGGPSASNYIIASNIVGGKLLQTVSSSPVVFPIGMSNYNPITLTNTGTSDVYSVGVSDVNAATVANNTTKQVNRNWQITEGTAGGSILSIVAQYNTSDGAQANFASGTTPKIGVLNGGIWLDNTATAAGSNPFTYTSTTPFSGLAGPFFIVGIGKDDSFLAIPSYTWNGSTSTAFATATNWTPNGIPTSTDNIIINVPGPNSLNITGSVTVNDFTLNGTGVLNMAAASTLTINGNVTTGGSAIASLNCSSTINIASASAQTVPAFNYGNLNISGGNRTLASSGTIGICGNYTTTAGTTTTTGSTVSFNGTVAQSINGTATTFAILTIANNAAFPLGVTTNVNVTIINNLTVNLNVSNGYLTLPAARTLTLNSGATATINGALDVFGTFVISAGATATVNGQLFNNQGGVITTTGSLAFAGFANYRHLYTTTAGTIPIATWAPGTTCHVNGYTTNTTTPGNFNQSFGNVYWFCPGTGAISIAGLTTVNGYFAIGGGCSLNMGATTNAITVGNYFQIETGTTFALSTAIGGDLTVGGNFINSGTFTANSRAVTFNGTSAQTITGATTFAFLTITNSVADVTAANALTVTNNLTINGGGLTRLNMGTNTLTLTGATSTITAGFLRSAGTITGGTNTFATGAGYEHNLNGGTIPTATWNFNSYCIIMGSTTTPPAGLGQSFGSFEWRCPSQTGAISLAGLTSVNGYFYLANDGSGSINMGATTNTLSITDNFQLDAGTSFTLSSAAGGNLNVSGNWNNSGTFTHNNRTVTFTGIFSQQIFDATTFGTLVINKASSSVTSTAAVTVANNLTLTNGILSLFANNLSLGTATITGGSATSYIATASSGQLRRTVTSSPILFPVGNTAYNPITLTNTGTSDVIGVSLQDGANGSTFNTAKAVFRNWTVTETVAGGSILAIVAQYNTADGAGANFATGTIPRIGVYNGSVWVQTNATPAGSNPFTYTSTSTITGPTSASYFIGIGKDDAFIQSTYITQANGNWNTAATWLGGVVPPANVDVTINHNVTLNVAAVTTGNITITSLGTLNIGSGNYLNSNASLINSGTLNVGTGYLFFLNSAAFLTNNGVFSQTGGEVRFVNTGTINGTSATTFHTISLYDGVTFPTNSTIIGNFYIRTGGYINGANAPAYSSSSQLYYDVVGPYTVGNEWAMGITTGNGVPETVRINSACNLSFGTSSSYHYAAIAIYIDGSLALSTVSGGDLKLGGHFLLGSSGVFTPNQRAVFFETTFTAPNIRKTNGGTINFDYLVHNSSLNIVLGSGANATDISIQAPLGGNGLALSGTGTLDLRGNTLYMNGAVPCNIDISGTGIRSITSTNGPSIVIFGGGNKTVTRSSGTATLNFSIITSVSLQGGVNFGSTLSTIDYYLSISSGGFVSTNPPTYSNTSTLDYQPGGTYVAGAEWATNATSGVGVPFNVNITNNTSLNFGASTLYRATRGNLSFAAAGNNLTLSTAVGGDLKIAGNLTYTGTGINHIASNNRTVSFFGTNVQTFTWPTVADLHAIEIDKTAGSITCTSAGLAYLRLLGGSSANILALTNGNITMGTGTTLRFNNTVAKNINIGVSGTRTLNSLTALGSGSLTITTSGSTQINLTDVSSTTSIDFGANLSTITNSFGLNAGSSVVNNAPAYGPSSTLTYNTGTLTRGLEWSSTSGYGYPNAVTVSAGVTLNFGVSAATATAIASVFNIQATAVVNMNSPSDMIANTQVTSLILSGTLNLSSSSGGSFTTNNGNITMNGTLNQNGNDFIVQGTSNGIILGTNAKFSRLFFNRTGVAPVHAVDISVCELFIGAGSNFNVQPNRKLTIDADLFTFLSGLPPPPSPSVNLTGSATLTTLGTGVIKFYGNANAGSTVTVNAPINLPFKKLEIEGVVALFNGLSHTISDTLIMGPGSSFSTSGNAPTYNASSFLIYAGNGNLIRGQEMSSTSGPGMPRNVSVRTNTNLQFASNGVNQNTAIRVTNNFTIEGGSTVNLNSGGNEFLATLQINGNLTIGNIGIGTLILSGSGSQAIQVGGHFANNAGSTFTPNGSKINFAGAAQQNLTFAGTGNLFYIELSGSSGAKLFSNISITNELEFNNASNGNIDLNNFNVTLGSTATIQGEDNNSRIINSAGSVIYNQGYIGYTKTVNSPSLTDVSNLGIELQSISGNIGNVTVRRYAQAINGVGTAASIARVYEVVAASALTATATVDYLNVAGELNGNSAIQGQFQLFNINGIANFNLGANYNYVSPSNIGVLQLNSPTNIDLISGSNFFTAASVVATPITGIINVPSDVLTVDEVVNDINVNGVGPGGVIINVAPGYIGTLGNIIIDVQNNPPSASNPIIFQGDPNNLPTFNARPGGTIDRDGVVRIVGTSFVTIQNIIFVDPPINDDNFERMEWGIAILKKTNNDASQNITIKNCRIFLQNADTASTGIYIGNHSFDPTQSFTPTLPTGNFDQIRIWGNAITRVNKGVILRGFAHPSFNLLEKNIFIGDSLITQNGNIFSNMGGNPTPTIGVHLNNAASFVIGNNSFDNTANGGQNSQGDIRGISVTGNSSGNSVIASNTLSLKQGTTNKPMMVINNGLNSPSAFLRIKKNVIQNSLVTAGSSGEFFAIRNVQPEIFKLQIDSNRIINNVNINTSANVYGIYNTSETERVYFLRDTVRNFTSSTPADMFVIYNPSGADSVVVAENTIVNISKSGSGGQLAVYFNDAVAGFVAMASQSNNGGVQIQAAIGVERIVKNYIKNVTGFGIADVRGVLTTGRTNFDKIVDQNKIKTFTAFGGTIKGITIADGNDISANTNTLDNYTSNSSIYAVEAINGVILSIDNDSIFNITQTGAGSAYGIYHTTTSSGGHTKNISNNDILNISKSTSTGDVYAIAHEESGNGSTSMTSNNNFIDDINNSGAGAAYGIYHTGSGSGGPHSINNTTNDIDGVTSSGAGAAYGIYHTGSGSGGPHSFNFTTNTIKNVSNTGAGSAYGIYHTGSGSGGPHNFTDNGNNLDIISNSSGGEAYGFFSESNGTGAAVNQSRTFSGNGISNVSNTGGGAAYGIYHTGSGSGGPHNVNSTTNTVGNVSSTGAGAAYGIYHTGSGSGGPHNVNSTTNTVGNVSSTGAGAAYGIYHTGSSSGGPNSFNNSNNTINNISNTSSGNAYGIYHTGSGSGGSSARVSNNISNVSNTGSGNAFGIYHTGSGSGGPHIGITRNNVITSLSTSAGSGACYGIYHTGSGSGGPHKARISGNTLSNFLSASDSIEGIRILTVDSISLSSNKIVEFATSSGRIDGINITSTKSSLEGVIANSVIGDFTTVSSNTNNSIVGVNVNGTAGNNLKFYYNSVHLQASSSGGSFGSSAFAFNTNVPVELKNNIFVNKSNAASGGGVRVLTRNGISGGLLSSSSNNAYFVSDSTVSNNFVFSDGTNNYQSFAAYRSFIGSENSSFAENVNFLSVDGSNSNFLKINTITETRVESGGTISNLGFTTDAISVLRFGALGYGGIGTATDVGAYENNYTPNLYEWLGLVSNNWNSPGNWTGGILPNSARDIVIKAVTSPQPNLNSLDANCRKIKFVPNGAINPTITIPSGRKLIVEGDVEGNGNFGGDGIVEFNSGLAQNIKGITTAVNVNINNSNGVSIAPLGKLSVSSELALKIGVLTTNSNNLVITSSGSTAGFINDFTGGYLGSISGGTQVQRFINNPLPASHTITSPVTNGSTVWQNYNDNFVVNGSPTGYVYNTNPNVTQPTQFPSTWWYDETLTATVTPGYVNGIAKVMSPGLGIMATIPQYRLIDVVGTANTGLYNIPVTKTDDGLNLIGNPYPSPISLNAVLATNSSTVLPFVYIWNKTNYAVYSSGAGLWVNNIGAGANDRLAHSQGFFVISTVPGTTNLVMNNSMRTTNQSHVYFATPQNECRIQLKDGVESDELLIRTDGESNDEYDMQTDAKKLLNEPIYSSTIYSLSKDNYPLTINTFKDFEQDKVVPVSIKSKTSGSKELQFNELSSIDPSVNVYLEDASLGKFQDMRANSKYEVNLTEGNSGSRFYVHFSKKALITAANAESQSMIYSSQNKLFLDLTNSKGNSEVRIYNSLGQMVEYKNISSSNGGKAQLNLDNLSGAYVVQLTTNGEVKNEKVVFGN